VTDKATIGLDFCCCFLVKIIRTLYVFEMFFTCHYTTNKIVNNITYDINVVYVFEMFYTCHCTTNKILNNITYDINVVYD